MGDRRPDEVQASLPAGRGRHRGNHRPRGRAAADRPAQARGRRAAGRRGGPRRRGRPAHRRVARRQIPIEVRVSPVGDLVGSFDELVKTGFDLILASDRRSTASPSSTEPRSCRRPRWSSDGRRGEGTSAWPRLLRRLVALHLHARDHQGDQPSSQRVGRPRSAESATTDSERVYVNCSRSSQPPVRSRPIWGRRRRDRRHVGGRNQRHLPRQGTRRNCSQDALRDVWFEDGDMNQLVASQKLAGIPLSWKASSHSCSGPR